MKTVKHILAAKKMPVISISPQAKIIDALQLMQQHNIGSIVVMKGEDYVGLVTERDYARKVVLMGKSSIDASVEEIMTTDLPGINADTTVETCMVIMSDRHIRYLPVIENGQFVQIISINDLITATIKDHVETIQHLKNYIQM